MNETKRNFSVEKLERVAKILKTISHPVKLEILEILEHEEDLDVSSLYARINFSCDLSMMSHHLSKMKDNGILNSVKRGKQVFYQVSDKSIFKIFDCMENCDLV